jgi:hypothetical protein
VAKHSWAATVTDHREPSLFALAIGMGSAGYMSEAERGHCDGLIRDIVSGASRESIDWRRLGDGAGWPEVAYDKMGMKNCDMELEESKAMAVLGLFELGGFQVNWPALLSKGVRRGTGMETWLQAKSQAHEIESECEPATKAKGPRHGL